MWPHVAAACHLHQKVLSEFPDCPSCNFPRMPQENLAAAMEVAASCIRCADRSGCPNRRLCSSLFFNALQEMVRMAAAAVP